MLNSIVFRKTVWQVLGSVFSRIEWILGCRSTIINSIVI